MWCRTPVWDPMRAPLCAGHRRGWWMWRHRVAWMRRCWCVTARERTRPATTQRVCWGCAPGGGLGGKGSWGQLGRGGGGGVWLSPANGRGHAAWVLTLWLWCCCVHHAIPATGVAPPTALICAPCTTLISCLTLPPPHPSLTVWRTTSCTLRCPCTVTSWSADVSRLTLTACDLCV